jgi:hypothetical protein
MLGTRGNGYITHQGGPDRAYKKTQIIEISNPITIDTVVQLFSHTSTVSPPRAGMAGGSRYSDVQRSFGSAQQHQISTHPPPPRA